VEVIPATLVLITLDGPDALRVLPELEAKIEDLRYSPEGWNFDWQIEKVVVNGKPEVPTCPWK